MNCNFRSTKDRDMQKHIESHTKTEITTKIVNKCNQCDFASFWPGALGRHLKTHSSSDRYLQRHLESQTKTESTTKKSKMVQIKCNQCHFTSSWPSALRRHLKTHSGEKSNKCHQCDFASSRTEYLRTHLKKHNEENQINATSVALHPLMQTL